MKVVRGLGATPDVAGGSVVAVGTFDGVHTGHRTLLSQTLSIARERKLTSAVVTWDRHPLETIRPEEAPPLLTSTDRKLELLGETGIDVALVIPFDEAFSLWPPERFVSEVLVERMHARLVRVGRNWRFGHRAAGDADLLAKLGADHGFEAEAIELHPSGDEAVSSTRIRTAIASGEMELARELLGRPFDADGLVVRGDGRGATLGFPTANLDIDPTLARPAQGVYAGRIEVSGTTYGAAINVGKNLTFGGQTVRVEAYILDFERDIYGETVRLAFSHRLRDELKFDSVGALIEQMKADVDKTRELIKPRRDRGRPESS